MHCHDRAAYLLATSHLGISRRWGLPLLLLLAWFAAASPPAAAEVLTGRASIIDADTLEIAGHTIRLHGIDAAETGQRCVGAGRKIVRPSIEAIKRLKQLAAGPITCTGEEIDDYGRLIAVCLNRQRININRILVREGHAWAFVKYSRDYIEEEAAARAGRRNVWAIRCDAPWVFREKRWTINATKAPGNCAIKGNISEKGLIYHMPWNKAYARTAIDTSKGERWFCNEGEALAAGWRPAKN